MLKGALVLLKVCVSILLLILMLHLVDLGALRSRLVAADPFWLAAAFAALACQFAISMLRWRDVGAALGVAITTRDALSLGLVGQMFNQVLPTSFGGDGVRILAMSRGGWPWTAAARTVLVDRALGLLFIVAAALLSLAVALVTGRPAIPGERLVAAIVLAMLAVAGAAVVYGAPRLDRLRERHAVLRPLASGLDGLRLVLSSRRWTPRILAKALLVHFLLVESFCFLAAALGIPIGRELFVMVTLIVLASAFPLSFAGWGVREGATVTGLAVLGVAQPDAILISVLHGVGQIVIGLFGIAWVPAWLFGKGEAAGEGPVADEAVAPGLAAER